MEKSIIRIIERKYPELAMGWHLPLWAKVVDILEPLSQQMATEENPIYAVSVQLLDRYGEVDKEVSVIEHVLLPVPAGGEQRGFWSKPMVDTVVEVAFAYGSPSHPFIRSILPHGLRLPAMAETSQRWQQSNEGYVQVDKDNDWKIKGNNEQRELGGDVVEKIGGSQTTTIQEDLTQQIAKVREIIASKHWVGSDAVNIYKLLEELMHTVNKIAEVGATHNHSYFWTKPGGAATTSPPLQTSTYVKEGSKATELAALLNPLLK